jgi:hypothetical protein
MSDRAEASFTGLTRANLEHALHVSSNTHLLGKLRALGEEDRLAEVVNLEHSST